MIFFSLSTKGKEKKTFNIGHHPVEKNTNNGKLLGESIARGTMHGRQAGTNVDSYLYAVFPKASINIR